MTKQLAEADRFALTLHLDLAPFFLDFPLAGPLPRLALTVQAELFEQSGDFGEDVSIVLTAWKELKDRCRVRRFWTNQVDEVGHIAHKRGGVWAFHYDIHGDPSHDESGFRFERHAFLPGEYVSIREQDGVLRTFRVVSRDQIMDLLRGHDWNPVDRSIGNLVVRRRRKIEADPERPRLIKTVRGAGYPFAADVRSGH